MNEQDLKYMISTYQQKSFELFNQLIASDSKVKQLSDLVEALTKKVNDQKEEIEALTSKTKRTTKTVSEDFK
jgi:ABC-type transporter Mla subunit MlaD